MTYKMSYQTLSSIKLYIPKHPFTHQYKLSDLSAIHSALGINDPINIEF